MSLDLNRFTRIEPGQTFRILPPEGIPHVPFFLTEAARKYPLGSPQFKDAVEKGTEEQRQQRIAARKASMTPQQRKHQVQGAVILGAAFSMLDSRSRRITEMEALPRSTRVRGRPEVMVVVDDEGGFDVDR